jgi:hypothetical protein
VSRPASTWALQLAAIEYGEDIEKSVQLLIEAAV